MKRKKLKVSFISLTFLLLLGLVGCNWPFSKINQNQTNINVSTAVKADEVQVSINYGTETKVLKTKLTEEKMALTILQLVTEENNIEFETKTYSFGQAIEKIGSKQNNVDGYYWLYDHNGKPATLGIDQEKVKPGDTLEFKYSKM